MTFNYKTASKKEWKEEFRRIEKESKDDTFFTGGEKKALVKILEDGEQVLAFTSGFMDNNTWLITLTDQRIIFLDKGFVYGLKQQAIPLSKVNAISGKTGLLVGDITITDGAKERNIENVAKKSVAVFTAKAQEAINNLNDLSSKEDKYDQLRKLSDLKDDGIITEEEFKKEKSKILEDN